MKRWDMEKERLLRQLWNHDKLTASKCAAVLGVTRNAVIGKVHRMCLEQRESPKLAKLSPEERRAHKLANQKKYIERVGRAKYVRKAAPKSNLPYVAPRATRKPTVVALPVRGGASDAALVAGWLAQNGGARRFERGATGDPAMLAIWLRGLGYQVKMSIAKTRPIQVIDPKGRHFNLSLSKLQDLVDGLRVEAGLEPMIVRAAA